MEIRVRDKRLKADLEDDSQCKRRFGVGWEKIRRRMDALAVAVSLEDFWPPRSGPEQCHELAGNRAGVFSMDVKQPKRLLFKPIEGDATLRENQQAYWRSIKGIEIVGIEDTHG